VLADGVVVVPLEPELELVAEELLDEVEPVEDGVELPVEDALPLLEDEDAPLPADGVAALLLAAVVAGLALDAFKLD
jgi:hypothetical protein